MKIKVKSSVLSSALKNVTKSVSSDKNALPVLRTVLIHAQQGRIILSGANLETFLQVIVPHEAIEEDGSANVNAKQLSDFVSTLPADEVIELVSSDNKISVNWSRGTTDFAYDNTLIFPDNVQPSDDKKILLDAQELLEALNRTLPSVANDEMRPILQCVYFDLEDGKCHIVSSDGKMLSVFDVVANSFGLETASLIVKGTAAQILKDIITKDSSAVLITFDNKKVSFNTGDCIVTAAQFDGRYPAYKSIVPKSWNGSVVFDRDTFIRTVKRLSLNGNKMLVIDVQDDRVEFSASNLDFGISSKEYEMREHTGDAIKVGLNPKNLINILDNIQSDKISFQYIDNARACLISPVTDDGQESNTYSIIMPLLIQ